MSWMQRIMRFGGPVAVFAGVLAMAACGSSATATGNAAAASTCTTTPRAGGAAASKTVTGTITTLGTGTITVTDSTGKATTVQYSSTTRYTHLQTIAASALTSGTNVTVLTQPAQANGTTIAQTIIVQTGAGNGGFGRGNGTPRAGGPGSSFLNAACFRRGNGTPRAGGANSPGFRGLTGTVSGYNAGTQQLTVTDTQGAAFLVTINASTTIGTASQGSQADLKQGATVTVRGAANGTSINAQQIQVFSTGQ